MKPLLIIDNAIPFLENRLDECFDYTILPPAEITPSAVKDASGLLVRTRTRCNEALLGNSSVSFVATGTIGLDHFDIPWLEKAGITWQNSPGCNAPAVAQYTWRALLALGFDPRSMTLGVVGKGHVGSIVAEWGRRLGAKVLVSDPPRKDMGLADEDYLALENLMNRVDAVTFHTPLILKRSDRVEDSYPTYHLADFDMLSILKPGAIIVNAARGGVVDEAALKKLKKEKAFLTALDTWEGEPSIDNEMLDMSDIATFHIAGYSRQGKERATFGILSGLESHFGVSLDKTGLAKPYTPPADLSTQSIIDSYDIYADDAQFRLHPENFESLRDNYPLRNEIF